MKELSVKHATDLAKLGWLFKVGKTVTLHNRPANEAFKKLSKQDKLREVSKDGNFVYWYLKGF